MKISKNQLANIGIHVPSGASSFHTTAGKATYLIGSTSEFVERELPAEAAARLRALYKIGGTFGAQITHNPA
jgi:hypothetical protein